MLYFDNGLFLRQPRIGIDVRRPVAAGFVSHAHFDHMARHRLVYCTPTTGEFFRHRVCLCEIRELPYYASKDIGGTRLTTYPAGHVLGSAMLLIENESHRVLYSGDFQLIKSEAAEPADPPCADTLIMECTFGRPEYVFPSRHEVIRQLVELVVGILSNGGSPVIHAYALGKAQTVTRILSAHGFKVYQHPEIFRISQIYERQGCSMGAFFEYLGRPRPGAVLIVPPRHHRAASIGNVPRAVRIGLTGWTFSKDCKKKLRVDHVLPFSDHADHKQLWALIERVNPNRIFCTHGAKSFVNELCDRGLDARWMDRKTSYCLDLGERQK